MLKHIILIGLVWGITGISFAQTNLIHIAVVEFTAPAGNQSLGNAAAALPDMLTATLSQNNRFQLVERDKINSVWGELHLTEAGLTSADSVVKLGKILSCDWLVSGTLVASESGPQIWVKVIDTQSGVVLDLQSLPYSSRNFSGTAKDIAAFLVQTKLRTRPHEFIAFEKFRDLSISSTREDWTPRLTTLIEKHFLEAGFGVVERDAVAPIFSEYQLQSAGLTADAKRVKLRPVFWIVSGSWKWFYDTQDKLSVTINIQKMGGGQQMLSFTKPPGVELEKAVLDTIASSLKSTGSVTEEQALIAEEKMRNIHIDELTKGRGENWTPSRFPSTTPLTSITVTDAYGGTRQVKMDPDFLAQRQSHVQEMTKTLQQVILLDPVAARSKFKLGRALYGAPDAGQSRQGEKLLEEVANSGDPTYAVQAKNWLADFRSGKLTFEHDRFGNLSIVTHGQPASIPAKTVSPVQEADKLAAWSAKVNEVTNLATRAHVVAQIPQHLLVTGEYDGITATKLWNRSVLIACGTDLKVDLATDPLK